MKEFDTLILIAIPDPTENCSIHYKNVRDLSKGKGLELMSKLEQENLQTLASFIPTHNIYAKNLAENMKQPVVEIEELSEEGNDVYGASMIISRKLNEFLKEDSTDRSWKTTIIATANVVSRIIKTLPVEHLEVEPYDLLIFSRSENSIQKVAVQALS